MLHLNRKFRFVLIVFAFVSSASHANDVYISEEIKTMFEAGLPIPVYLHLTKENTKQIGYVDVVGKDGKYKIRNPQLELNDQGFKLKDETIQQIKSVANLELESGKKTELAKGASVFFDAQYLSIELYLEEDAFESITEAHEVQLGESSSNGLSGVVDYSMNTYYSYYDGDGSLSGSLYLNSNTSYKEHHLILDASANLGGYSDVDLEALVYERDYNGRRIAAGLLSGQYLQSTANVSTLDSDFIYAVSYGNETSTRLEDEARSLTPVNLYFPSNGEARVFRDGDLISIQQFSLGSHQLDTSLLPSGIYQITVQIVTNGQVSSTRQFRINKPSSSINSDFQWQIWAGYADPDESDFSFIFDDNDNQDEDGKVLAGISVSYHLRDIIWSSSLYFNGDVLVQEGQASIPLLSSLSLDVNNLLASDDSRNLELTLNYDLPYDIGQVWGNYAIGHLGTSSNLDSYSFDDYYGFGGSFPLSGIVHWAGTLNLSYDQSKSLEDSSDYTSTQITYQQSLFNYRWLSSQMTIGYNYSDSSYGSESEDYYVNLNLHIPIDTNVSIGYSHHDYGNSLDVSADTSFDEGSFIESVGVSASTDFKDSSSYSGYATYRGKYAQGTVTAQGDNDSNGTISLTAQGGIGWNTKSMAASNESGESGVIVELPDNVPSDSIELVVGDYSYPLSGGNNFIPIDDYTQYSAFIRSVAGADANYTIKDTHQKYNIYPGNVVTINPDIKQIATIFTQVLDGDGNGISDVTIHSNNGTSGITDEDGFFSVDVNVTSYDGYLTAEIDGEERQVKLALPENYESMIMIAPVVLRDM